jgi:hypothetical protein
MAEVLAAVKLGACFIQQSSVLHLTDFSRMLIADRASA